MGWAGGFHGLEPWCDAGLPESSTGILGHHLQTRSSRGAPSAPDDEYDDWATKLLAQINKGDNEVKAKQAITDFFEAATALSFP